MNPSVLRLARKLFHHTYGSEPIGVAWAPGRANLVGLHVDHTGGSINAMALPWGAWVAFGPGPKGKIELAGPGGKKTHKLRSWIKPESLSWNEYVRTCPAGSPWQGYVECGLGSSLKPGDEKKKGLRLAVGGDLPQAKGLSSSGALVVASHLAGLKFFGRPLNPRKALRRAGPSEQRMGARIGLGDHAAILLCQKGKILNTDPQARTPGWVPWPQDLALWLLDSGVSVRKGAGAKQKFNRGPAAYRTGLSLLGAKKGWGPLVIQRPQDQIKKLLSSLPYKDDDGIPLRAINTYGASECARARLFAKLLKQRNWRKAMDLMNISQRADLGLRPPTKALSPRRSLERISGWYGASHPRLDRMHQRIRRLPGILAARTLGAGMGGMVCVVGKKSQGLEGRLEGLSSRVMRFEPGGGAWCESL